MHRGENRSGSEVEVHKTVDGKVIALVYRSEADVGKLMRAERVEVFAFFEPGDDHPVPVGLPQSRVRDIRYQYHDYSLAVIQ